MSLSGNMVKVLELLSREKSKIKEISKHIRLPESVVKSVVEVLTDRGYVRLNGDDVEITEKGIKYLEEIKKI